MISQLGLEGAKAVSTPGVNEKLEKEGREEISLEGASQYRSLTARANYLAGDRPDIQFSMKQCAKHMSKPRAEDPPKLKRLTRYLEGKPRAVHLFEWGNGGGCAKLSVQSDSDWAGDKETRKCTSGGNVRMGCSLVKSWSKGRS